MMGYYNNFMFFQLKRKRLLSTKSMCDTVPEDFRGWKDKVTRPFPPVVCYGERELRQVADTRNTRQEGV